MILLRISTEPESGTYRSPGSAGADSTDPRSFHASSSYRAGYVSLPLAFSCRIEQTIPVTVSTMKIPTIIRNESMNS